MATKNWLTRNVPGLLEYLDGDPSAPGYRADHGGANYHSHLAFGSREQTLQAKQALEKHGIRVTGFGDRSGHAENSYHYKDQALDIPGAQWGKGTDAEVFAGSKRVREILLNTFGGKSGGGGGGATASSGGGADGVIPASGGDQGTIPVEPMQPIKPLSISVPTPSQDGNAGSASSFAPVSEGRKKYEQVISQRKAGSNWVQQMVMQLLAGK